MSIWYYNVYFIVVKRSHTVNMTNGILTWTNKDFWVLYLKPDTKTVFLKWTILLFTSKDKINDEVYRLVHKKLIMHVEIAEWANPIIPVVKWDGTRICL